MRKALGLILAVFSFTACALFDPKVIAELRPDFQLPGKAPGVGYVEFAAFGDTGTGDQNQKDVAAAIAAYGLSSPLNFAVLLGDNFYEAGVASADDDQFRTKFEEIYSLGGLDVPFYAVLGNHDYYGNEQAQIDYYLANQAASNWNMPDYYYAFTEQIPGGTETIRVYMIDTNILLKDPVRADEELSWLEAELGASTAAWNVVCGHHTVYSSGAHGSTGDVKALLEPLFRAYGVDLYLCGHDHDLEILKPQGGVSYAVSGSGGKVRPDDYGFLSVYYANRYGATIVRISEGELALIPILANGSADYFYAIDK